jgi:GTPase Era involved in 16S rRNA processing
MHPGWVDTPGLEKSLPAFHRQLSPWLRTPAQGADTIVWLAAAPDAHRASGQFWLDRKIRATHVFGHTRSSSRDNRELIKVLDEVSGLA